MENRKFYMKNNSTTQERISNIPIAAKLIVHDALKLIRLSSIFRYFKAAN